MRAEDRTGPAGARNWAALDWAVSVATAALIQPGGGRPGLWQKAAFLATLCHQKQNARGPAAGVV